MRERHNHLFDNEYKQKKNFIFKIKKTTTILSFFFLLLELISIFRLNVALSIDYDSFFKHEIVSRIFREIKILFDIKNIWKIR